MCLIVNDRIHPRLGFIHRARVAAYDILCWKVMHDDGYGWPHLKRSWVTPFRAFLMRFGERYYAPMEVCSRDGSISKGFHASRKKTSAKSLAERLNPDSNQVFPAIIPAGTPFFIGLHGDIVADSMIVYKTLEEAMVGRVERKASLAAHKFHSAE